MPSACNMPKPRLEWRAEAIEGLFDIVAYIADDNPDAAQALKDEIETKVNRLPAQPRLYKLSALANGLREMVVRRNFIVLYRESPIGCRW